MDAVILKTHRIQSLTVFADLNEDDIREKCAESGKIREMEFNQDGFLTYRLSSDNRGNLPFIHYGRGSFIELFTHNLKNLLISSYTENYLNSQREIRDYDPFGNLSGIQMTMDGRVALKVQFQREKDKMVKSTDINANNPNLSHTILYDEKGRMTYSSFQNLKISKVYEDQNDTLIVTTKV